MKKLFLLTIATSFGVCAFAQSKFGHGNFAADAKFSVPVAVKNIKTERTTSTVVTTDTIANITSTDTATLYYFPGTDSGFVAGMNYYDFDGYAERFDFNPIVDTIQVLGMIPVFGITVNPSSTNQITLKAWTQGAPSVASATAAYNGLPGTLLDSVNVYDTSLGVTSSTLGEKAFYFATPTAYLTDSFFVGYTMNYTWGSTNGDTLALATNRQGHRVSNPYTIISGDTLINDQNAFSVGGTWYDFAYDLGLTTDLWVFPIVHVKTHTTGLQNGITNRNFTFFGNYPNPAVNSTNIKFSLATSTDVYIQVTDVNGRVVKNITENNLSAGEHIINMETANMPAGDYVYVIRAAAGGGIASKLTVIK